MSTWGMWDWKVGESAFRTAIELNPNHALAHAYYSHLLNITKRPLEAIKEIELAIKLDPYNPLLKSLYAADLLIVRRYNEAIEAADDSLKMDSNGPVALTMYEMALYHKGKYKEALEPIKKIWGVLYGFSDFGDKLENDYESKGFSFAVNDMADNILKQSEITYINPFEITCLYLMAWNSQQALNCAEKALELRDPNLLYLLMPIYDNIRDDPRFQAIARKMNLPYK